MITPDFGYVDNPANGLGIIRARTLIGNLRLWDIPKSEQAIDMVVNEVGRSPIPGIYMLFEEGIGKGVYIGQTENIKNWNRAIIINDGRNAEQSDMNDENIRLTLENYLVNLFKVNRYKVVTSSIRTPGLSSTQNIITMSFKDEIIILLTRKSKISKVLTEKGDDEIYNDEVRKIIERKGYSIKNWGKIEAIINGKTAFIRPGSSKKIGWQITFRGAKPNSFKTLLEKENGFLLVPRGPILLIPLSDIKRFVLKVDKNAFLRDTMDIFIKFHEDRIMLIYKSNEFNITKHSILPFPHKI
ncbi:hypothetical protein JW926_04420 [Candidatus Sumerlaeota bacterium]|nr:hypothetical protein [Candidatus Sumerlaeota bacterium]